MITQLFKSARPTLTLSALLFLLTAPSCDSVNDQDPRVPDAVLKPDMTADVVADVLDLPRSCVPDAAPGCKSGWCLIASGSFMMGSSSADPCSEGDETPHQVTLTRSFAMSSTEVTQGQFYEVMGYNPSCFKSTGGCHPVEYMRWDEAAAYCNALSARNKLSFCYQCTGSKQTVKCMTDVYWSTSGRTFQDCPGFRLPTEAEWEFAYRAGMSTEYYGGKFTGSCLGTDPVADKIGFYKFNSPLPQTNLVGLKQINPWGLYDMAGNVWDMVEDSYQPGIGTTPQTNPLVTTGTLGRVVKGGSYSDAATHLRAATRFWNNGKYWQNVGFRCVRSR